ncbi:MAG: hypothetical protein ACI9OJ_004955 [Myxococcota bacterium]|jgi:hypothetical protein
MAVEDDAMQAEADDVTEAAVPDVEVRDAMVRLAVARLAVALGVAARADRAHRFDSALSRRRQ